MPRLLAATLACLGLGSLLSSSAALGVIAMSCKIHQVKFCSQMHCRAIVYTIGCWIHIVCWIQHTEYSIQDTSYRILTGRKHRMPDLRKLATQKVPHKLPQRDPKATHRSIKGPNLDTRSIAALNCINRKYAQATTTQGGCTRR